MTPTPNIICKSKIGPLRSVNSENESALFCDDPKGMADILQTQFTSVFSNPQNTHRTRSDIDLNRAPDISNTLEDITFTLEDLIKAIDEIKANSASGNDGFAAILLKKCKANLA